jgi:NAD(P)-dependent dehydrogenase (short-subunit alcohol dehydrogenase family)
MYVPPTGERNPGAFAGKAAIVTGGGSGIGAAIARALAARGATVVIADIDEPAAKTVAGAITAAGGHASFAVLDVRDAVAVADLVSQTVAEHGELGLMFNNAGIAVGGPAEQLTLDHWDRVLDVNVRGVVHGVHAAYPVMLHQGHGHIVNTASLAGLVPGPGLAPYAAAKHAVVGLSLSLRAEGASRGVKVSAVCPGFVDTPLLGRVNAGLPQIEMDADAATLAQRLGKLYQPDALAQDVLRGVERNRALIVAPRSARIAWRTVRYAPRLAMRTAIAWAGRDAEARAAATSVLEQSPAVAGSSTPRD